MESIDARIRSIFKQTPPNVSANHEIFTQENILHVTNTRSWEAKKEFCMALCEILPPVVPIFVFEELAKGAHYSNPMRPVFKESASLSQKQYCSLFFPSSLVQFSSIGIHICLVSFI